jgi:hypothetical protein
MRNIYLLITAILLGVSASAQTWNGTNNTDWDDGTNWSGGVAPTPSGAVTIPGSPTGGRFPKFTTNVSINSINMQPGSQLDVNGKSLTLTTASQYVFLSGTINNTGAGGIIINVNTGTGGYGMYIRSGAIFNSDLTINATGSNVLYEGDVAGANQFNGNVTYNINSALSVNLGDVVKSTYTGSLSVVRTVAGSTTMFNSGASIGGNLLYSSAVGGATVMGNGTNMTAVAGTINLSCLNAVAGVNTFQLLGVRNSTGGGTINIQNSKGFTFTNDTLTVNSIALTGYSGSAYATFSSNRIIGNFTTADDVSYNGGYYTLIDNNTFTGNANFTVKGPNIFYDANTVNETNTYNGNVTYNLDSTGDAYISSGDTVSVSGNLTINRSGNGNTTAFGTGGIIGGNFSYTNNVAGNLYLGTLNSTTFISGTITIAKSDTIPRVIQLYRIKNSTPGGSISSNHSLGFDLRSDTLKVASLSLLDYQGNQYAYLLDNMITGSVTTADNAGYAGGYYTDLANNYITGNADFTVNGTNTFYDANAANTTNTFIGNVTYNITGSSNVSIATGDTVAVTGNLIVNRTSAGNTYFFGLGGIIGGNFQFTNNTTGVSAIGNLTSTTNIGGTVNVDMLYTSNDLVNIYRLKNSAGSGHVTLQNTSGFDIRQDTLTVNTVSLTGYRGSAYAYFYDTKLTGNLVVADDASYAGGYYTNINNNYISGTASFTNNGTNTFYDGNSTNTGSTYLGNVSYTRSATGGLMSVASGDTCFYGSGLTFNSSMAQPINSTYLQFISNANGAFGQTGTQPFIIPYVIMRKSPTAKLSLSNPLTIGNNLVLDSGIIAATATNKLIIPDNISYTGSSNKSFVEGPMDKIGNEAFIFPVGKDSVIAPISMSAPSVNTDVFTASYIHMHPESGGYDTAMKAGTLDHVSRSEYWILNRTAGTSNVSVTLSYDTLRRSGRVINPSQLRVSRWNGTLWADEGNGGTTGTPAMGTVISGAAVTSFGPFTLASTTAQNTLPVTLVSFTATEQNGVVTLLWKTENEINFSHYEVERSSNVNAFSEVLSKVARNQGSESLYSGTDLPNATGVFYYRLKMVDKDGKIAYSNIVSVKIKSTLSITLSPNPVRDRMIVNGLAVGSTVRIVDVSGKLVITIVATSSTNQTIDIPKLQSGMYMLQVLKDNSMQTVSFIKD